VRGGLGEKEGKEGLAPFEGCRFRVGDARNRVEKNTLARERKEKHMMYPLNEEERTSKDEEGIQCVRGPLILAGKGRLSEALCKTKKRKNGRKERG